MSFASSGVEVVSVAAQTPVVSPISWWTCLKEARMQQFQFGNWVGLLDDSQSYEPISRLSGDGGGTR